MYKRQLLGIITSADVVELVDDEMGDDYAKLGGLTSEEAVSYTHLDVYKRQDNSFAKRPRTRSAAHGGTAAGLLI